MALTGLRAVFTHYPIHHMSQLLNKLQGIIAEAEDDFQKFYNKDNKAAGTRVRKAMQEVKKVAQDIRVDVQNRKNAGM